MNSRNQKQKEKIEKQLNNSNYCLFDEDEDDKKEENNYNFQNKKSSEEIEFFNPKTQILKRSNKFENLYKNEKNDNFLMNSFELLGEKSSRDKDSSRKENINYKEDNIFGNINNKIDNDINSNINKDKFEPNKLNSKYIFNNIEDNLDSNFNINNYIINNNNNIKNYDLKNIDNNDTDFNNIDKNNRLNKSDNNMNNNKNNNMNNKMSNNINNINNNLNNNLNNKVNNYSNFNNINSKNIMNNNNNKSNNNINENNNEDKINNNINKFNNIKQNLNINSNDDFIFKNRSINKINDFNNNDKKERSINKTCIIYDNNINNNYKNNNLNNNKNSNINNNKQNYNANPIKVNESKNFNKMKIKNIHEQLKNQQNKKNLEFNSKTVINKKRSGKSPFMIKRETEEERMRREKQEKEQKDIRKNLQCYLCFGKAINARICRNCQKIACDQCVKNMISKIGKCRNCQKDSTLDDIISIPWMEDLTSFFINNVENYQNQKIKNINNINKIEDEENEDMEENFNNNEQYNIKGNNINNNYINEDNEITQFCDKHKDKKIEYFCLQCSEFFCSKCLMFTNQSVIEKHKNHKIMEYKNLKKYNINEAIQEYKKLKDSSINLDILLTKCNDKIKEIGVKKIRINDILEMIKKENEQKCDEQINQLNELKKKIMKQKENIDNSIDSVPNSFNNIIERNDYGQGEQILEELKKLNTKYDNKEENFEKYNFKLNLCFEWFESENIKINLPNEGNYVEEFIFFDKQINIIPEHICKFKAQLLGGNMVFILSIEINDEYYLKNNPKFYVHFVFRNIDNNNLYCVFYGDIYSNGVEILSAELSFEEVKKVFDKENSFELKLNVLKSYYK